MDKIIYFLVGAIAVLIILIFWLWRTNRKLKRMEGEFAKMQYDMKKVGNDVALVKGKLTQIENVQFDFSELEERIEENAGQLINFVRQEIGQTIRDMRDLDGRIGDLEVATEEESRVLEEVKEKFEEMAEAEEEEAAEAEEVG